MIRKIIFALLLPIFVLCLSLPLYGNGLSTTFGELKVEDLKIGEEYSTEEQAGFPLVVHNTSDETVELKVDVLYPKKQELKEGFEPIPDTAWVTLEKGHFVIGPDEKAKTDVVIRIPNDDGLVGKKYQVYLWSHTIGRSLGVGLKSRLLFTISE